MRDDVDDRDVQVAADRFEEIAQIIDVVGVRGLQVDRPRTEVTRRPDDLVGVPRGAQKAALVQQVPGPDIGRSPVAVHQQHRSEAPFGDHDPVRRPVGLRVAAESAQQ
jgi:hypothetical protein